MARKGRIEREKKLKVKIEKFKAKRALLVSRIIDLENKKRSSDDEKTVSECSREVFAIMRFLQRKRGYSYIRARNRCQLTGRTGGYLGMFKICRGMVRYLASFGLLNGVKKSSHS